MALLCLGLVYHFRDQQFVIDFLSTLDLKDLIISVQTHHSDKLMLVNRLEPDVGLLARFLQSAPDVLSGWHPIPRQYITSVGSAKFEPLEFLPSSTKDLLLLTLNPLTI